MESKAAILESNDKFSYSGTEDLAGRLYISNRNRDDPRDEWQKSLANEHTTQ
jgi:hypothetical protein